MRPLPDLLTPMLLSAAMVLLPAPLPAQDAPSAASTSATGFGEALNAFRAQNGRGALREDAHLTAAAQAHAADMAAHGYFSHPGRDGSSVAQRAQAAGCRGQGYFAENIAWGQSSAQASFSGWAASAGHRDNMLGQAYGAFGLGRSGGMWVLIFADGC